MFLVFCSGITTRFEAMLGVGVWTVGRDCLKVGGRAVTWRVFFGSGNAGFGLCYLGSRRIFEDAVVGRVEF